MLVNKHPFTCCTAAKHQNAAILELRHMRKTSGLFYGTAQASTLVPGLISLTVSIPVKSIIPCMLPHLVVELSSQANFITDNSSLLWC